MEKKCNPSHIVVDKYNFPQEVRDGDFLESKFVKRIPDETLHPLLYAHFPRATHISQTMSDSNKMLDFLEDLFENNATGYRITYNKCSGEFYRFDVYARGNGESNASEVTTTQCDRELAQAILEPSFWPANK